MNLGDSAVDSFEYQYHQRPPPPLPRAPEYLAAQKVMIPKSMVMTRGEVALCLPF